MPPSIFERPLLSPRHVYPCTVDDLRRQLARVPEADLEGLHAVGLVPATERDCWVNGRYFYRTQPVIHLYSLRDTRTYRLRPGTPFGHIDRYLAVELEYGMQVERVGARWVCSWSAEDHRRFIMEHVLLHEIGHHVYYTRRQRAGYTYCPSWVESEQFAEAYALRWKRQQS